MKPFEEIRYTIKFNNKDGPTYSTVLERSPESESLRELLKWLGGTLVKVKVIEVLDEEKPKKK